MMKKWITTCLLIASAITMQGQQKQNDKLPYRDSSLSAEQRANDLLQRLTLEEKVSLMQNASPAIPRLGIKPYEWWNEALHGIARAGLATVFPQTIGMAASFDNELVYKVFTAVSDEARAKNREFNKQGQYKRYQGLTVWTPNVNIFRDPRWGRGQETYGEDPYLTSRMGVAVVEGLQGPNAKYDKLHACAKHYAVHSGPEWNRHSFNAENVDPRDLWETYLPAFKTLVQEAKVKEVMCAYNRFEGDPCCGSNRLLTQILRNDWGYKGIVVSDCGAISDFWQKGKHETHKDAAHASAGAVLSGTDLECGNNYNNLSEAVKAGYIDEEKINVSVARLLQARFELGEMEDVHPWSEIPYSVVDCQEHRQLALQIARETITLLQNKNNVLPLNKSMKIAVMGPNANDSVMQWANYNGIPSHTITLLKGLRNYLPASNIIYEQGCGHTDTTLFVSLFNQCRTNSGNGFQSTYWNNDNFSGQVAAQAQQATPFIFNTDGATAFASGVNLKDFSAKYETTFYPTESEEVIFRMQMRGAYELYVNDQLVKSDEGAIKTMTQVYRMKVEAGKAYNITLKYNKANKTATLCFDMGVNRNIDVPAILKRIKDADIVLFAGGISPLLEGEEMPVHVPGFKGGDRTDIELPKVQRELLAALKAAGKRIVYVNFSGSAMALEPESKNCEAILQAWYPGQEGGTAIAEVLFGDYNPAGRLPITFYKSTEQLPDFQDYSMKGRTYRYMNSAPLFAFGEGLSYTTFSFGKAQVNKTKLTANDKLTLLIPVKNIGSRNGEEVVQVYLRRPADKEGPAKTLRAFKRVAIAKGSTQNVEIEIPYQQFEWFDTATNTMRPVKGKYEVLYGSSSKDKDLQKIVVEILE